MTDLEMLFYIHKHYNGVYWAFFAIDIPEWTLPQYLHQN